MNLESGAHTGEYILMLVSIAIAVLGIGLHIDGIITNANGLHHAGCHQF